jgi:hypothetical protein
MTVYPFLRILVVAGLLGSAGCGDDEPYETVGDAIRAIGSAWCDRAIECGAVTEADREVCEAAFTSEACDAGDCGADFDSTAERVDDCIAAFGDFSCEALDEVLPAECRSL